MVIVEGKIKGKARPRVVNGHAFTPKETVNYENWIRLNYKDQCGKYFEGPVSARIEVYFKIPRSYTKKQRKAIIEGAALPIKKPDADNIAKIVLDSINGLAYADDRQVVILTVLKRFTEDAERIEFELEGI